MNKSVLAAMLMALTLAACGDQPTEPVASVPVASAVSAPEAPAMEASAAASEVPASEAAEARPASAVSAPAASEPVAPAATAPKLDPSCQAYFDRVERCLAKVDQGVAAAFANENTELKNSLAQEPAADQARSCQSANEQFNESAKVLECE